MAHQLEPQPIFITSQEDSKGPSMPTFLIVGCHKLDEVFTSITTLKIQEGLSEAI